VATSVQWGLDSTCCVVWASLDPALQDRAEELAWSTLRTLSGGRIGNCPAVIRPCLTAPCDYCATPLPTIRDGEWINVVCGSPRCSCERLCEIVFPGPIAAIVEIDLGGVDMPMSSFRVDNGNRLVRQDSECWPSCQNLGAPVGDPDTLTITYVPGILPSDGALWAAGTLACEFARACSGGKCRLPSGITSIARQGVQFTLSSGMFPDGMTGIREVDAYLTSINPNALRIPPMVWSPDVPWARHRYTTPTVPVEP